MAAISIACDDSEVQAALDRLSQAAATLDMPLRTLGTLLCQAITARVQNQVGPNGEPWAPISDKWRTRKQRLGLGDRMLVASGRMSGLVPGWLDWSANGLGLAITTAVPYANFVQYGTRFMPARRWFGPSSSDRGQVFRALITHLTSALVGSNAP